MKNKFGQQLVKKVVNELAIKKAGTNCSGFMYEVKKPDAIKKNSSLKKGNKIFCAVLVATMLVCGFNHANVYAAVRGEVTGTLNQNYVSGKLTCNEAGHRLTVVLNYQTRSTLTGNATSHTVSNDVFGNNTEVTKYVSAGVHESASYLNVIGKVDNVNKQNFEVSSYGTTTREYW